MDGFAAKIGIYDIFSRFVAGFAFLLNLFIITFPFIPLDKFYLYLPDKVEFLSVLIIVTLAYVLGIALAPLGVLLGHLLFKADIEHAIDRYKQAIEGKQEASHWKQLISLLQKIFGTNLSLRSYLNVARAKLKEECPNATNDIDRLNATSIMMRSIATTELITALAALVILINIKSDHLFYSILLLCSVLLFAVLFHQSIKSQRWWVGQVFETFYAMNITSLDSKALPSNVFRANVGILVINGEGKVLALERSDIKGAWQLPQGGIEEHECALEAAFREVQEETNLGRSNLQFVAEYPEWLAYELSREKRSGKYGRGQVQKWYLFRFTGADTHINLDRTKDQEFSSWKWINLQDLIKEIVSFRRSIYNKIADGFSQYLAK